VCQSPLPSGAITAGCRDLLDEAGIARIDGDLPGTSARHFAALLCLTARSHWDRTTRASQQ
jgi:hypothetical protein